jgi:hypothetical protein
MSVCCDSCVSFVRYLCDRPIARPEESYRVCGVPECDLETSTTRKPRPTRAVKP